LSLTTSFAVESPESKGTPKMPPQSFQFTPQWPHGNIHPIFQDVFFVTGTNKIHHDGVDIQTSRNMTIIRNGQELTLINTVRLDNEGLKELDLLGTVNNIVKIGAFHGRDDAFYKDRYPNARLWALKGAAYESGLKIDQEIAPNGPMPFQNCSLFVFETSSQPECILHVAKEGGILISCDSIQNITSTDEFYSPETARSFHDQGLVKPANISPIWLNATQTKAADFERLLKSFTFHHLLTAHGKPLIKTAYEEVGKTVQRVFSPPNSKFRARL
jgi:hypothetical protein